MDIFCSLSKTPESHSNQEHYLSPADYILLRSSSLFGAHFSVQVAVFGSIASICLLSFKAINPPSNWLWHLIKPSLTIVFQVDWQKPLVLNSSCSLYCIISTYPSLHQQSMSLKFISLQIVSYLSSAF